MQFVASGRLHLFAVDSVAVPAVCKTPARQAVWPSHRAAYSQRSFSSDTLRVSNLLPFVKDRPVTCRASRLQAPSYDIVGLGQAMCDLSGTVDPEYLVAKRVCRGGRRVIDERERSELLDELAARGFELNAAGSLANTLAGCALLGQARHTASGKPSMSRPRIAMAGPIGDDRFGAVFQQQYAQTGVEWIERPLPHSSTGTVMVLTTPDAQRSFLSFPGAPMRLSISSQTRAAISKARCLLIEGYLWEFPGAADVITRIMRKAHRSGVTVAMTVADVSVVTRFRTEMVNAMKVADIIFTNADEARALVGTGLGASFTQLLPHEQPSGPLSAQAAALQLGRLCPVAVVTDGSRGSCVTALGQLHVIPPHWSRKAPVDTCGAGDAYAAGFLHGYLSGMAVSDMGSFASAAASAVISHHGPQLRPEEAHVLAAWRPAPASMPRLRTECNEADSLWESSRAWSIEAAV